MRKLASLALAALCACSTTGKPKADDKEPKPLTANDVIVLQPAVAARGMDADTKVLHEQLEAAATAGVKSLRVVPRDELAKVMSDKGLKVSVDRSGFAVSQLLKDLGAGYALYGVVDKAESTGQGMLLALITQDGDRSAEWIKGGQPEVTAALPTVLGSLLQDLGAPSTGPVKYPSGLVVEILEPGKGPRPRPTERVKVNYEGKLADGTIFDSTRKRGEPAVFGLDRVILCWNEGIPKLRPGAHARLTCPPAIAYGERGQPPTIGPQATLFFDVDLISIEK